MRLSQLSGDFLVTEAVTSRLNTQAQRLHLRIILGNVQVISDSTERADPAYDGHRFTSREGAHIVLMSPPSGLDGYVNELRILRISNGDFFGSWNSSVSYVFETDSARNILPNPSGYFCAREIPMGKVRRSR
jgi:hypothetical protein